MSGARRVRAAWERAVRALRGRPAPSTAQAAAAEAVRAMRRGPPYDPQVAAEAAGLTVLFAAFVEDGAPVAGLIDHGAGVIYVDRDLDGERTMATLARQLGHHLMHPGWVAGPDYEAEPHERTPTPMDREADEFARAFLVPEAALRRYAPIAGDASLARLFCVDRATLRRRLTETGLHRRRIG